MSKRLALLAALALASGPLSGAGRNPAVPGPVDAALPEDHRALTRSTSYEEMEAFLKTIDGNGPIAVSVEGIVAAAK